MSCLVPSDTFNILPSGREPRVALLTLPTHSTESKIIIIHITISNHFRFIGITTTLDICDFFKLGTFKIYYFQNLCNWIVLIIYLLLCYRTLEDVTINGFLRSANIPHQKQLIKGGESMYRGKVYMTVISRMNHIL